MLIVLSAFQLDKEAEGRGRGGGEGRVRVMRQGVAEQGGGDYNKKNAHSRKMKGHVRNVHR